MKISPLNHQPSLRQQAEEVLKQRENAALTQPGTDDPDYVHELELKNIELELTRDILSEINEKLSSTNAELLQAKEIAEEREMKYKLLYDFNPMPMSIFDTQSLEFLSVNEAFCDKYGFTKQEFLNMTILQIRPDTEIEKLKQSVNLTDTGVTNAGIFLHKKKNGEIIQVEIIRHELLFDNRKAKLVLINDVTEKRKAEAVLMETQLKLNEAYKLAHIGIWEWETQTDTVTWTEELYHIAGLDPLLRAPTYKEQATLYSPESWEILNALVGRTLETGEPYQAELELIRPGGDIRYVKAFGGVKKDANGQIKGLFGTLQDITELKQAEKAVNEKHELFRKTFNISPLSSVMTKLPERTIVEVNPAFEKLFGYTSNEIIGKPVYELDLWADAKEKERIAHLLLENGKVYDQEFVFKTKAGKTGHGIFYAEVIDQKDEKYVLTKVLDITGRKLVEAAWHESEILFSRAFSSSPVAITITNRNSGKFIEVNNAWSSINGFTAKEAIGHSPAELNIIDAETRQKIIDEIKTKGSLTNIELSLKDKTGNYHTILFSSEDIEIAGEPCVLSTGIDITERKHAEEKLSRSESELKRAQQITHIGSWYLDVATNEVVWTEELYKMYGFDPTLPPPPYTEHQKLFTPESWELLSSSLANTNDSGIPYEIELRTIKDNGSNGWMWARGETVKDPDGKTIGLWGAAQDITERKQAEEKIRQKDQEFRKLSASLPDLIYQFTRNPDGTYRVPVASDGIRNIFGCSPEDVLDDFGPIASVIYPEDAERVIRDIEHSAEHLTYFTCEFRVQIPGREIQWIFSRSTPERLPDGSITWYGFNADITERKLAEEAMKENNSRLELAMQSANMAWWEMDITTGKVIFDHRKSEMVGYPAEKFKHYKDFMALVHPEDSGKAMNAMKKHIDGLSDKYEVEYRILTQSGEYKWFYDIGTIVKNDPNGIPLKATGLVIDITERKQADEALRMREYLLSSSQQAAHVGTWSWKVGDTAVYWSDETYRIYGLSPEMGPPDFGFFFEIIHPEDRHKMREWPEDVIAGLHPSPVEFRVLRPDGIYRVIRTEGDVVDTIDGVPSRIAGTAYDITELKLAEEEIHQLNERIATATSSAQVGIWDWDVVNNLLVWDDQMYQLYGLKKDGFAGAYEAWVSGLHPDDREFSQNETSQALQGVKAYDSEFRVVWPDGSIRYLKAKGEVFRGDEGNPIRMLGVNFDITDRKQAEENIRQLNEELEQRVLDRTAQLEAANKELEAFSYTVSHDLRAPLRHINGFVDLLNENYQNLLPEKGQHYLTVIRDSSTQMGTLIDDLLQFSRTGRQEMQQMNLDMNRILQEVVKFFIEDNKYRNIDWEIAVMPKITGDMSLLRMVWVNLVSNAVKFTKDREPARIKIGYTEEMKVFIFYIRDNGAGFDMPYAHKLFGVFQRLHSKQEFEGTGIGLANAHRIITRHGGRIWAESELNQGTTFYFTLPKTKENSK
jgi:PAS domain S-box-containing protein